MPSDVEPLPDSKVGTPTHIILIHVNILNLTYDFLQRFAIPTVHHSWWEFVELDIERFLLENKILKSKFWIEISKA